MTDKQLSQATFGGGCFWCLESIFDQLQGVEQVRSGYAGGHVENPTYEQVCTDTTGHAEVVQILFDPAVISYQDLLEVFFNTHNPTTLNRQGNDIGSQYRSAIFYHDQEQKQLSAEAKLKYQENWPDPIVTQIVPVTEFYPAGDYHEDYFARNPEQGYCQLVIAPKVSKFKTKFMQMLKK